MSAYVADFQVGVLAGEFVDPSTELVTPDVLFVLCPDLRNLVAYLLKLAVDRMQAGR